MALPISADLPAPNKVRASALVQTKNPTR